MNLIKFPLLAAIAAVIMYAPVLADLAPAAEPDALCRVRYDRFRSLVQVTDSPANWHLISVTWTNDTAVPCEMDVEVTSGLLTHVQPRHPAPACVYAGGVSARCTGMLPVGETALIEFYTTPERLDTFEGVGHVTDQVRTRPAFTYKFFAESLYIPTVAR